uniref:Uncharacterized protein n=1 Tax=Ascaris lumbricoides TaxID=6252 RepID=A0A0M3IQP9_ASCLU
MGRGGVDDGNHTVSVAVNLKDTASEQCKCKHTELLLLVFHDRRHTPPHSFANGRNHDRTHTKRTTRSRLAALVPPTATHQTRPSRYDRPISVTHGCRNEMPDYRTPELLKNMTIGCCMRRMTPFSVNMLGNIVHAEIYSYNMVF